MLLTWVLTVRSLITSASATLHGSFFTARGGSEARGMNNFGINTVLEATGVTALGEGGSNNYGLYQSSGTVSLGVTQLDGTTYRNSGTLTCFQVYDGSFAPIDCSGL
jgi:hypothetical protein